jgi:hypothetical protein
MNEQTISKGIDIIFRRGEHVWDDFLHYLKQHPVILPDLLIAELEEEGRDVLSDETWFVFSVKFPWSGESKFFKATTETSSFGGTGHSHLAEVSKQVVTRTSWEQV